MRKGQVALEFIMTYGWAILVVLAAIGALAYFGVLSPSKYLPEKCIFTTGVGCKDFAMLQSGNDLVVRFTLTNGLGSNVVVDEGLSATYGGTLIGCASDTGWTAGSLTFAADASEGFTCTFTGDNPGAGQSVKTKIAINYTFADGIYPKQAVGDISGKVQE